MKKILLTIMVNAISRVIAQLIIAAIAALF